LVVHDVLDHFDKISSCLTYAFRSKSPVGYIVGGNFHPNSRTESTPHTAAPSSGTPSRNARIAPPLLKHSSIEHILNYMQAIGQAEPPYDGIVIEGLPPRRAPYVQYGDRSPPERSKLNATVRWLNQRGIPVVFCN